MPSSGQERIGQLLSSKPLDRRSIIEEAAGITRFKTKKRPQPRLEFREEILRVNDIFEEVTRQMGSLKRQAAKAERYGALRDELRGKLRVVIASRLTQMDAEQAATGAEITRLASLIDSQAAELETMDAEHSAGVSRGYELDGQIREAGSRANSSAVELERITARHGSNTDRIADLEQRMTTANDDLASASTARNLVLLRTRAASQLPRECDGRAKRIARRGAGEAVTGARGDCSVLAAEATAENQRRAATQQMLRAAQANNEIAQAEAALQGLERENERLAAESETARGELESLARSAARLAMEPEECWPSD